MVTNWRLHCGYAEHCEIQTEGSVAVIVDISGDFRSETMSRWGSHEPTRKMETGECFVSLEFLGHHCVNLFSVLA